MPTPLSNRPKITAQSVLNGYVLRYFVQLKLDTQHVVEIDESQFNSFKSDTRYVTVRLPWIIGGSAYDQKTEDGKTIQGAQTLNTNIVNYYSKKIKNLDRYLPNKLEYFNGSFVERNVLPQ